MIEQTTLHNILTWVIAVVLFIFQSLNYFIAWIKKYVKHGQKTTTVVTADTTISSESILNNKNVPENVITVQGLIQKHFDIPLIIAEDEPKVYSFIKSAQLLNSNEIRNEKTKIDQFMENLVDDSYVARGLGLITATVGRQSEFYLYSKYDNNFDNISIRLNGRNGEIGQITILSKNPANIVEPKSIPMDYIYDKDRIKVIYTPFAEGVYTLTLVRNSLSICRSPYYISVEKSPTNSRSQIRLGTKKYKPVTKCSKSKQSSLETCDNSIPVIEPSKPSICKNILPESEKTPKRTDVMSIVTKFESNSVNFKKRVHKNTSSISEKSSEADMINEIPKYSNILPKIETYNIHDTYVSDLNVPKIHSKTKSTDKNFWNDVDITYKNSKASDINTIDSESERIKKPMTKFNEHVGITKDIPEVKNVSSTRLQPTNSVLVESLKIENLHNVKKHNQTFKTIELMDENKLIEKLLDPTTRIYESEIKCIDNEPCIQNEVSCFDDEDRKTVVVMDNNEIESNPNDTVTQQIIDSAQYNINTPFASVITKITNSICEKCSIQVLKIISEFPRDINITHKNNSNEMQSSFETLLAQPISININIDNMFEQPINATNEHDSEHLLTNGQTKIKHIGTIDKDIKCSHLNEIESIDNDSDELCGNINNMPKELMIKQNKHNSKIDETIKDEIFDHSIVPFADHTRDKQFAVRKNNELSTNEIMKIKYSTTNEDNVLHSNQFNNNTIHKSDSKMEIHRQHLQKSSEHSIDLIKTNQFHENLNKELNPVSKESNKPLDTSNLVTINFDKNTNCELVTDEFKINNVIFPDENTNIQSSVINNIVLASKEVTLATTEYKSEDNKEQTNNISYKDVTLTLIQNEKQKLIIEKSIEPVLNSFKNKMVEKITQLYLNRDLLNTDNTSTFETHDKHLTNNLHEIQINNNTNSTEIILDQQKTDNNHLHKYVENIIKTKINPNGLYAHTLGEIKLQTLVNTAMNHPNDQQIDIEFKNMIIDNDTQDDKLKKINNDEIVQDLEAVLVEIPSVTIIKNTDEIILPKNEVTVTTQCKIPLINDFDNIEIENTNTDSKQEIQTINVNENDTIVETNAVEIKALQDFQKSHNTEIITPFIELRPTLETRIMNTLELVTVEENSSKEIQTTIDIIDSINIPEETDAVENIDDKNEYETVKLQFTENVIKIPHLVEKETLNEVVQNTSTKSNSTESVSMQAEIESPGLTKVCSANDVTIEKDIIYELPPPAENIFDKSNSQSIPTLNAKVSKNAAKVTIGINTSDLQFSNTAITVLIPSKIQLIENNSFILKLRILSTLDKLDAMEILTIPKYPATCDTEKTKRELQNTPEPTLSPNKLYMKNIRLEKRETIDETIPTDTEIETLEYLNKSVKIKPISNDILEETMESKTEKNTLHKTLNPKYKVTTLESTVNEINCDNTENETTISISSSAGEVVEKPIKKHTEIESTPLIYSQCEPDKKVDEMLICTEAETPTIIDNSTAPLVGKIVVEFVTNKNKIPIEALEIIVHEQIEEDIVTVSEISPTMNSLGAIVDEQVNIKIDGSDTYYVRLDDNVINTGTNTRTSIGQNNAEKIIEKESPVPINTLTGVVMENPKMNIATVTETTSCTNSATETTDVKTDVEKVIEEESPSPISSSGELVQENMNMNIKTENETLLPIESTVESNVEPKIENITEPEITSCTESSTEIINNQFHAEKIVDDVLIDSLGEVEGENMNTKIVTENETLLSNCSTEESMVEPKVEEDITVTTKTASAGSSTLTVDVHTDVEKVIEEESPSPISSLGELVQENMYMNIKTENETLLPIESTVESIAEPKVEEDITVTTKTASADSSTLTVDVQTDVEKVIEEESPSPISSLGELVQENMYMNIKTENETLLPIESTVESIAEPKIENITEPEITSCTESSTEIINIQFHAEKIVDHVLIDSLGEVEGGNMNTKIVTVNETLLSNCSTEESMMEPKVEEDITVATKTASADSSTLTVDVQTDVEKVIEEESTAPKNVLSELVVLNIDTENETLLKIDKITGSVEEKEETDGLIQTILPMKLTTESIKEPNGIEDITEITSCTESSTKIIQYQDHAEKMFDQEALPVPINFLEEEVDRKSKVIIDIETETHLPIVSTIETIEKPKLVESIIATEIPYCTESSTEITDKQIDSDNVIVEPSPTPINILSEIVGVKTKLNINTESEALLPMLNYVEEKEVIEETSEIVLPIESAMEFIQEPKLEEDIIEIKIRSYTDSSTVVNQKDIKNVIEEESSTPIHSLGEVVEKNMNDNIDKENEILLPNDSITGSMEEKKEKDGHIDPLLTMKSTMESIKEPKEDEDITVAEITSCTNSSSVILEIQMGVEKVIEEVPAELINSKIIGEKTKVNIDTEYETILLTESTIESIAEPEINEDITQTKIVSCTAPSNATINVQTDLEKVIEERSKAPINCSDEEVGGKSNVNIHTENEILLPIELTMETITIPKTVENITKTKISSCTDSCILTVDALTDAEKGLDVVTPEPINYSGAVVAEKTNMDIGTGKETKLPILTSTPSVEDRKSIEGTTEIVLPIKSTMVFNKEPKVVEDKTVTEITLCTDFASLNLETKIDVENVTDEVSMAPINSFDEEVGGKSKVNIGTENETVLPIKTSTGLVEDRKAIEGSTELILLIESNIEFKEESIVVEDINVTEITACTDSSSIIVETKTGLEKVIEEVPTVLINSSCKVIGEKTQVNMDTEYETILPIGLTMESVEEPNAVEDITETEIASCTESSTENMIDVQSNKQKYMTEKSPVPIDSSDVGRKSKVNFDTEDETFLPMVSTKDSIDKEFDEVIPEPINSSGNAVVEKIDMNIDTGNETILPVKKSTSSVEDRKAIEATAGIVLPIEFTMEFKKEPKVVEDIPVTEITEYTDSCIFTVDGQTNIEKKLNVVNPVLFNSSGKIIGEKTKVNMDTEYETILPIGLTMESVEEPNAVEDITETEITSCTEFSTENMIDDQTNNKNYMAKKSPTPINSSVEEVGGKSKVNIDSEDEKLLPILSTKESIEEIKIEPTVVTETNILSCTESSTIIINYQNHTEKNVDDVLIDSLGEVEGENMNTKIVTENETLLSNCSTEESMVEPKVEEDITVTTKTASADSSTLTVDVQTDVEKVIEEESPSPISSLGELVQENMYMNIKTENETLLPIESTVESIGEPKIENITEPEITSCTESSTEIINNQFHAEKIVGDVLIDSLGEVEGENMNTKIVTENETLLSNCSTEESMVEPKVEEDITVTTKTASADSSTLTVDVQTDVEKVIEEESPSPISSLGELVQENMYMNIKTENETLLPIESTVESIAEPKIENITEPEITSCTESSTEIINIQFHAEKIVDHVLIDSLGEVEGENMNTKIVTENETLLSNCSTEKSMVEPKVEEDITVTTKTASADSSTLTVDVQTDLEKIIEEESLSQIKSLGKEVQVNTKNETLLQIDTSTSSVEEMKEIDELIKTLLPIKSDMESIKKVEDINETKKISITNSSIITKDIQTGVDIVENKSPTQVNFSVNILGENTKVNNDTENDTILPIESAEELTVQPKVEADITETATTSCTDSSSVPVDVRTSVEKVIKEVSPAPSHSSGEVLGESTKLYIDTENETLLQNDKSITPVKVVLEEKIIENEYSTPTFSPFLDVEKQINAIIDSKTETLFPTGTNTTFVNEPNVVEHVSENEHAAFIDSSITSIKQQIKVDTKTEIETLLLIDNLTESIKEQIVETITENKTPTLIDSLAEMAGEGSKVNIDTDNQTQLTINTSSTIVDDQIVKNCSENEAQTPIHCVANIAEEQTKVNVERNNKTITPIDIFTTSIEEQLNVEYLCENENPLHIDSVPTMIKNQMKINIETENETLLSIENTSFEDQMDEVDKIIQNNLLVDFSVATELKGYEILTDIETEPTTSIDTLNTTVNRRAVKENFKAIESRIQIATSAAFEEEQKSIEHISVKENVLSIGTTTASVEEEIQVEEAIENESATLISYSTIHDIGSLEEPKVIKNDTTAMKSFVTVVEDQIEVSAAEVVIDTCKESLDKTMIEKGTHHNETPNTIGILVTATEKQTDLEKVTENEILILANTSTKSVEKQIKTEKITEKEISTLIACEALPKIETNEFETESENETSTPVNNSASITIKQTEAEDVTETTLQNDDIIYRNTKTNFISTENKTENSDNPNNCYLKFGESSKMHRLKNEDNLKRKSYGIQKLEMSVQRMKTSDEDYYEKTFVQLEQTEKISKVDNVDVDDENKTIIDDKLYTVNESDLNAIVCASSLEEALTLLDSKIKFKFKHKKSSSKINSVEYIPKIQTSDNNSSGVNTNFTDARKFFKEIEKKSKK